MKLPQILATLRNEPLFCTSEYRALLLDMFQQHAELTGPEFRAARTGKAKSGSELDVDQMEIIGGIAHIPIGGPIGMNFGEFEKGAGCVDVDDIGRELDEAETNDEVETILLNIDSPGGMVTGTPELGQKILEVEKPIYAFTRGQMASAAYWLACSCDGIFATPSADVGSIGVCASFLDLSKMADMAGIKVKVFGSGDYKGAGAQGTSLTAKQEVFFQQRVMQLAQGFYDHVRSQRGAIDDADMQGQMFKAKEAMDRGFIDGVMNSRAELVAFLR